MRSDDTSTLRPLDGGQVGVTIGEALLCLVLSPSAGANMLPALILAAGLTSSPHLVGSSAAPGRPADAHVRHLQHVAHLEYLHWRHLEHLARERSEVPSQPGEVGPVVATAVVPSGDVLSCTGLEHLWDAVGGNPSDAFLAAEIAEAESSGYQYATGPYGERGFWQINPDHGSLSTYDKYGNARAAVLISHDGSDWFPWTTYTSGAYIGRCLVCPCAVTVRTRLTSGHPRAITVVTWLLLRRFES